MGEPTGLLRIPDDALIESSFRRLLSAIDSEKESIRQQWQELELERDVTTSEIHNRRVQCENWCTAQQKAIDAKWDKLARLSEQMEKFWRSEGPEYPIVINCVSGGFQRFFMLPRTTLQGVKESELARMFSSEMLHELPRDAEGRILLDVNPECFALIVEYLQNRRLKPDCPTPHVPNEQQQNMEILAERLKLTPFLKPNSIADVHSTSLQVSGNMVTATHPSWQLISSKKPLSVTRVSYFETTVISNPDTKGALAVGICNRIPTGDEAYSIRLVGSVLCVSNAGLKGDMCEHYDEIRNIAPVDLKAGAVLGIRLEPMTFTVTWYINKTPLGSTQLREDRLGLMRTLFPVFAMYIPDQKIKVQFDLIPPDALPAIMD